jgi:hypothetical protein
MAEASSNDKLASDVQRLKHLAEGTVTCETINRQEIQPRKEYKLIEGANVSGPKYGSNTFRSIVSR